MKLRICDGDVKRIETASVTAVERIFARQFRQFVLTDLSPTTDKHERVSP